MIIKYNIDNIFISNCKSHFYSVTISFKFLINSVYILHIMVSSILYTFHYDNTSIISTAALNTHLTSHNRSN